MNKFAYKKKEWTAPDGKTVPYSEARLMIKDGHLVDFSSNSEIDIYIQVSKWLRNVKLYVVVDVIGGEEFTHGNEGVGVVPAYERTEIYKAGVYTVAEFEAHPLLCLGDAIRLYNIKVAEYQF